MIILDTNVVSEVMHPRGDDGVRLWAANVDEPALCIITLQEIAFGAHRVPDTERRERILGQLAIVTQSLGPRVLVLDEEVAMLAGAILAQRLSHGRPMSEADAQIAATCLVHKAALATRSTKDFEGLGVELINPWDLTIPA